MTVQHSKYKSSERVWLLGDGRTENTDKRAHTHTTEQNKRVIKGSGLTRNIDLRNQTNQTRRVETNMTYPSTLNRDLTATASRGTSTAMMEGLGKEGKRDKGPVLDNPSASSERKILPPSSR